MVRESGNASAFYMLHMKSRDMQLWKMSKIHMLKCIHIYLCTYVCSVLKQIHSDSIFTHTYTRTCLVNCVWACLALSTHALQTLSSFMCSELQTVGTQLQILIETSERFVDLLRCRSRYYTMTAAGNPARVASMC